MITPNSRAVGVRTTSFQKLSTSYDLPSCQAGLVDEQAGRAPKVLGFGVIIPENKEIHSHDVGTLGSGLRPLEERARVGGGQGIRQRVQVFVAAS